MISKDQPLPFPGQEPANEAEIQPPVDLTEIARRIGATARPFEYRDRTSEAARDQGHGPIDTPISQDLPDPVVPRTKAQSRRSHPAASGVLRPVADVIEFPQGGRSNKPVATGKPSESDREAFQRSKADRDALRKQLKDKSQE